MTKLPSERRKLLEEVEEGLDLEGVLKDLAMLNEGLEEEEEEEIEEKEEEELPAEKETKIESIKEKYQSLEREIVPLKRESESIEELLGVAPDVEVGFHFVVNCRSQRRNRVNRNRRNQKWKKSRIVERLLCRLPELTQEEIQGMIHSLGADQFVGKREVNNL